MKRSTKLIFVFSLLIIGLIIPLSAYAGIAGPKDGITLNYPDSGISCNPTFNITTTGVLDEWTVDYSLSRHPGDGNLVEIYSGQGLPGNLDLSLPDTLTTGQFTYRLIVTVNRSALEKTIFSVQWKVTCREGCTPGFWKNHEDLFPVPAGSDFDTLFFGDFFNPDITMGEAVDLNGGHLNALTRHAAAGYLNSLILDDYPLSTASVVGLFNSAFSSGDYNSAKDLLDQYNNMYCPLG